LLLIPKSSMARRKPDFFTSFAAFRGATHIRLRSCFSGQSSCWWVTSSGKIWTSHSTDCFFLCLRFRKRPICFSPISPCTPASSYASITAVSWGVVRLIGHPFGTDQRHFFLVVMSIISRSSSRVRKGRAANCLNFTGRPLRKLYN